MRITLNGEDQELALGTTVAKLVENPSLTNRRTAVEINQMVISRSAYAETILREGDAVEIVHAVGGG